MVQKMIEIKIFSFCLILIFIYQWLKKGDFKVILLVLSGIYEVIWDLEFVVSEGKIGRYYQY